MDRTPLKAGTVIVSARDDLDGRLTEGQSYTVLADEYTDANGWRIIRVTCNDGVAGKVPPAFFKNAFGDPLGCMKCYDRGVIHGGEEMGAYIKRCDCQRN